MNQRANSVSPVLLAALFIAASASASFLMASATARTAMENMEFPLQSMSFQEADSAGTTGTGCTWLDGRTHARRMSMTDDRAIVKLDGHIVALTPIENAGRLPAFTFADWSGGGMRISIHDTGRVTRRGSEFRETIASIEMAWGKGVGRWTGSLACGS